MRDQRGCQPLLAATASCSCTARAEGCGVSGAAPPAQTARDLPAAIPRGRCPRCLPLHAVVPGAKARPGIHQNGGVLSTPRHHSSSTFCSNGFICYGTVGEEDVSEKLAN